MKSTSLVIASTLLVIGSRLYAQDNAYGKELTLKSATKISDILANPRKFDGKKVLVEGTVLDVCTHQGCWIMVAGDKENESIRFKVEDGVIVFPVEAKGKKARVEGVISVKTLSKEKQIQQGEYHAKEEGKTFDPSSVKGPKTVVQIEGEGAVIQ